MYKKIVALSLIGLLGFQSCDDQLDINRDPDSLSPEAIPMNSEMPTGITGVGASAGSYFALAGGFWSQFWTQSAVANQYKALDDYSLNGGDNIVTGAWTSMYDALTDVRNVKKNAELAENWNYYLIATVMEVYASQLLVDFYGSIPYTEANNSAILNPAFQSADEVYDLMVSDLKLALSKDLSASSTDVIPGNDDFLFGGDMDKWKQFANTLLLKLYLRQTEVRPSVAQSGVQSLAGVSFLTEDAAITQFVDEANRSNPLYESDRRQLNVATNLRASTTMGAYLQENSDTLRLSNFYDGTTFQNQGDFDNAAGASVSVVVLNATDPVYFISAAESYFLQAEAALRYGTGDAQALYEAGVMAAFSQFGLDGSSFVSGVYAYPAGSMEENLEAIIVQKWVSFFPGKGYESFIEQNRTGYPAISSVVQASESYVPGELVYSLEGVTGNGNFPRRFEYSQTEGQRNSNAPDTTIDITEPVWYDAN